MSLTDRMLDTRDPKNWDEPPTDEEALRQFLYSGIASFIEENESAIIEWMRTDNDEIPVLSRWVDEYSDRPLSEKDGYARENA